MRDIIGLASAGVEPAAEVVIRPSISGEHDKSFPAEAVTTDRFPVSERASFR